jgi:hypothetical protein
MFGSNNDDGNDHDSDGVPRPMVAIIHAEPTDKTIRGFALSMDTAVVLTTSADMPTAAMPQGDVADGSIDAPGRLAPGVPIAEDDAPTMQVTPMDVGYRYAVLRQLAVVIAQGGHTGGLPRVRHVNGMLPFEVTTTPDNRDRVTVVIRRWRDVAAWVRQAALDDFVVLKASFQGWPDEVRTGARAVLRQITEACHKPPAYAADGFVYLSL